MRMAESTTPFTVPMTEMSATTLGSVCAPDPKRRAKKSPSEASPASMTAAGPSIVERPTK